MRLSVKVSEYLLGILSIALVGQTFSIRQKTSTLILVDPFTEYISGACKDYCNANDIRVVECVSPYMCAVMSSQGSNVPSSLRAPKKGEDIEEWASENDIQPGESVCVFSESDAGVGTAESIQESLGIAGNGVGMHVRNKYLLNRRLKENGMKVVKQKLATSWDEAEIFLGKLWKSKPTRDSKRESQASQSQGTNACVIKPYRGVASDGVYKCESVEEAKTAFEALFQQPQYGGGINDAVLIQEYVTGNEYAVDTVSKDGKVKVTALWKYDKLPANGAPFVYQCSYLHPTDSEEAKAVCKYAAESIKASGIRWGATHTEVMATENGPRMIEINPRWHAQCCKPICDRALGYDATSAAVDAVFNPKKFDALPDIPTPRAAGVIIHLISRREGTVKKLQHVDKIQNLTSFVKIDLDYPEGSTVTKTKDIRTDCGYVVLAHEDPKVVRADYERVKQLQNSLFVLEGDEEKRKEGQRRTRDKMIANSKSTPKADKIDKELDKIYGDPGKKGAQKVKQASSAGGARSALAQKAAAQKTSKSRLSSASTPASSSSSQRSQRSSDSMPRSSPSRSEARGLSNRQRSRLPKVPTQKVSVTEKANSAIAKTVQHVRSTSDTRLRKLSKMKGSQETEIARQSNAKAETPAKGKKNISSSSSSSSKASSKLSSKSKSLSSDSSVRRQKPAPVKMAEVTRNKKLEREKVSSRSSDDDDDGDGDKRSKGDNDNTPPPTASGTGKGSRKDSKDAKESKSAVARDLLDAQVGSGGTLQARETKSPIAATPRTSASASESDGVRSRTEKRSEMMKSIRSAMDTAVEAPVGQAGAEGSRTKGSDRASVESTLPRKSRLRAYAKDAAETTASASTSTDSSSSLQSNAQSMQRVSAVKLPESVRARTRAQRTSRSILDGAQRTSRSDADSDTESKTVPMAETIPQQQHIQEAEGEAEKLLQKQQKLLYAQQRPAQNAEERPERRREGGYNGTGRRYGRTMRSVGDTQHVPQGQQGQQGQHTQQALPQAQTHGMIEQGMEAQQEWYQGDSRMHTQEESYMQNVYTPSSAVTLPRKTLKPVFKKILKVVIGTLALSLGSFLVSLFTAMFIIPKTGMSRLILR